MQTTDRGLFGRLADFLHAKLDIRVSPLTELDDIAFFEADLTPWHLNLCDRTPFVGISPKRLADSEVPALIQDLESQVLTNKWAGAIIFLIVDAADPAAALLHEAARGSEHRFVAFSRNEVEGVLDSKPHPRPLVSLICQHVRLSELSPYETSAAVVGPRFFGRSVETRSILDNSETNFLVLGVRRIGKTSLLLQAKNLMERSPKYKGHGPILYFACNTFRDADDFVSAVTTQLDIRALRRMNTREFPNLLRRASHSGKKPLVLLLDEMDALLQFDRLSRWLLRDVLKASSDHKYCRYIMAGFREADKEWSDLGSPIHGFAERIVLRNFNQEAVRDMVLKPMSYLGIAFQREASLVGRIQEETGGHPNLVQFYCQSLLKLLDSDTSGRRELSPDDLPSLYNDPDFTNYVLSTFDSNTSPLEKLIVYSFCAEPKEQFTLEKIVAKLARRKVMPKVDEVKSSCKNLTMAGILALSGNLYGFSVPALPRLLDQHYDISLLIDRLIGDEGLRQAKRLEHS